MKLSFPNHALLAGNKSNLVGGQSMTAISSGGSRPLNRARRAFSLIEIMVTVSLLTVIVLGLLMVFNQTQRAFRLSATQVDVLESGRAVMALLKRDLEQTTPTHLQYPNWGDPAFPFPTNANFFAELAPPLRLGLRPAPLVLNLPGTVSMRTNLLQDFFFVTRANQRWAGVGYLVSHATSGIGTLYRFESPPNVPLSGFNTNFDQAVRDLYINFPDSTTNANLSRIAEGVVQLRLIAYGTNGFAIDTNRFAMGPTNYFVKNTYVEGDTAYISTNNSAQFAAPGGIRYYFGSNAVPAYVDVELGILESPVVERVKAFPNPAVQRQYLEGQAGRVHVFRQRVAIHTVEPEVYQ